MYRRFFSAPKQGYFLFGPRGTGKSSWLKREYSDAFWVDLLDPEVFRVYSARPERLRAVLDQQPNTRVVVVDEVQRAPELLNVIHALIEEKRGLQFIMTGSSSRKLRKYGVNLLGGRALVRHMPPFYAAELGDDFELSKNIRLGMLPIVLDAPDPEEVLRAYAGMYLKEEVQAEGIVRNVGDFARFLETMSFSHASLLNGSTIARECHIARKTVDSYLKILEDLLLAFQLDVFRFKAKRQLASHPKFYFFDSGVYCSIRPHTLHDVESEKEGPALEGLVAQHLRAWTLAQREPHQLNFWRTSSKLEVDFIVSGPTCFFAVEVKNGTTVHPHDLRGLEAFVEEYPHASPVLLYRGKDVYRERNIVCCPVDRFLANIAPDMPIKLQTGERF